MNWQKSPRGLIVKHPLIVKFAIECCLLGASVRMGYINNVMRGDTEIEAKLSFSFISVSAQKFLS